VTVNKGTPGGGEVLLVEDDAGDALIVEELLSSANSGLSTVVASTIAAAAKRISRRTVCILLDLGLPDGTGLDAVRRVLDVAGRVPVIVLTGRTDREIGDAAVVEGAQDYLVKGSVGGEALTRAIRYAIERKRGQDTVRELQQAQLVAAEKARLERGLLPRPILHNPALKWATRYRPGGSRALLGGDFYDGIELPDGTFRIMIGDVTGHGPDEAALGVALRVAWRTLVLAGQAEEDVLREVQKVLVLERHHADVFATVCDVTIHPDLRGGQMRLAGHPSPLVVRGQKVEEVSRPERGPLLGLADEAAWQTGPVELGDEWGLILYTDGLVEGLTPSGERLDVDGLAQLAADALQAGYGLGGLADHLITRAEAANGGPLPDDAALFLVGVGDRW
jgi:serine phosphatase RsbU (regulator of sigma subunit)